MRNDFKPMRNASFLRINDRNSMRNTILYPILLYYWFTYNYRIIYENMRNENEKSGSSSNLVVISFLFQLSSSFLILLKVVDMFAF